MTGREMHKFIGTGLAFLMLGACSDAASQAPVDLKPGLYDINVSGDQYLYAARNEPRAQKCFTDFEAKEVGRLPMLHATYRDDDCTDTVEGRQGNAIKGKRFCSRAAFRDNDDWQATYVAEISEDGFIIKGETRDEFDETGGITQWRAVGRRVGDC